MIETATHIDCTDSTTKNNVLYQQGGVDTEHEHYEEELEHDEEDDFIGDATDTADVTYTADAAATDTLDAELTSGATDTDVLTAGQESEKSKHKKKRFRFYDSYIPKILKGSFENHGITSDAKQQLNSILIIFSKKLAEITLRLTEISGKRTLSSKEVQGATEIFLSGELKNISVSEGTKAVKQYTENTKKGVSRQAKAGIIFPPSVTEKFLRRFDTSVVMVTHTAPVFFAAVIEYICMEIIELASLLAKEEHRIRITVSDIESSVKNDGELARIFSNNNIK